MKKFNFFFLFPIIIVHMHIPTIAMETTTIIDESGDESSYIFAHEMTWKMLEALFEYGDEVNSRSISKLKRFGESITQHLEKEFLIAIEEEKKELMRRRLDRCEKLLDYDYIDKLAFLISKKRKNIEPIICRIMSQKRAAHFTLSEITSSFQLSEQTQALLNIIFDHDLPEQESLKESKESIEEFIKKYRPQTDLSGIDKKILKKNAEEEVTTKNFNDSFDRLVAQEFSLGSPLLETLLSYAEEFVKFNNHFGYSIVKKFIQNSYPELFELYPHEITPTSLETAFKRSAESMLIIPPYFRQLCSPLIIDDEAKIVLPADFEHATMQTFNIEKYTWQEGFFLPLLGLKASAEFEKFFEEEYKKRAQRKNLETPEITNRSRKNATSSLKRLSIGAKGSILPVRQGTLPNCNDAACRNMHTTANIFTQQLIWQLNDIKFDNIKFDKVDSLIYNFTINHTNDSLASLEELASEFAKIKNNIGVSVIRGILASKNGENTGTQIFENLRRKAKEEDKMLKKNISFLPDRQIMATDWLDPGRKALVEKKLRLIDKYAKCHGFFKKSALEGILEEDQPDNAIALPTNRKPNLRQITATTSCTNSEKKTRTLKWKKIRKSKKNDK